MTAASAANPTEMLALMKGMNEGIPSLPSWVTSIPVLGNNYTMAQVQAKLSAFQTPYADAAQKEQAYQLALDARTEIEADAQAFVSATVGAFKSAFGRKSPQLETLGLAPDKTPAPLTADQKVTKAAKSNATRKARGTLGPKQKAKIKGQVPPAASPPATTPAATPPAAPHA